MLQNSVYSPVLTLPADEVEGMFGFTTYHTNTTFLGHQILYTR